MATFIPEDSIRCEKCHEHFYRYVEITNVIDTDKMSSFAMDAISGIINRVVCPFCKSEFTYENPMVLHSHTSKIVCYTCYDVLPLVCRDFKFLTKITHSTDWRFRLCKFTMDGAEKIRIFKDDLNDAAIEVLKLKSFSEYRTLILEDEYITYERRDSENLYFSKRNDLDSILSEFNVPYREYLSINNSMSDIPLAEWLAIDRDWAIKYTEEKL